MHQPPRWAVRFFDWYCHPGLSEEIKGDLLEQFEHDLDTIGPTKARRNFVLHVIKFFHPKIYKRSYSFAKPTIMMMFLSYLKLAKRSMIKDKVYSVINIAGLSVGLAAGLMITMHIIHELSYDKFHDKADRIYRVAELVTQEGETIENSASLPIPFGTTFLTDYPQFKVTRFFETYNKSPLISWEEGDKRFYEDQFLFTDSSFFDIFSFKLIKGDKATALKDAHAVVLTESMARKYFGDVDPIGKTLKYEKDHLLTVTGVMEDVPSNSHFKFDFLASFQETAQVLKAGGVGSVGDSWFWNPCHTYMRLPEGFHTSDLENLLTEFTQKRVPENLRSDALSISFYPQPLTDIHLHSDLYQEFEPNGSASSVYFSGIISFFILLIAGVNFVNLSTARAVRRSREVGVRKSLGARRSQLIWQFLVESVLISVESMLLALAFIYLLGPSMENLLQLQLGMEVILNPIFHVALWSLVILLGLTAGAYPAFILSGYKPTVIFSDSTNRAGVRRSSWVREGLVIFQLSISTFLIIATIIVFNQREFLFNKDLGFEKENIVMFSIRGTELKDNFEVFRGEVLKHPKVVEASALGSPLGEDALVTRTYFEGIENHLNVYMIAADPNFLNTFGFEVIEGQKPIPGQPIEYDRYYANETFLELFPDSSLASLPRLVGRKRDRQDPIVGIIKDFHFYSLRSEIKPFLFRVIPANHLSFAAVKIQPGSTFNTLNFIEETGQKFIGEQPVDFFFLDDRLDQLYQKEQQASLLFGYFAMLALIITCLGLFSLSSYLATQKTKEISIRKVFGASIANILSNIFKGYLKLILAACIIVVPLSWFMMSNWLQHFAYHVELSWYTIAVGVMASGLIAVVTVSFQSIKAARTNPADSLRLE
ncbi:MAG: FtsX-like permease family protein [Bacteroidota bacterium]